MTYQLILGDCIEGMRAMADKSVAHPSRPSLRKSHANEGIGARPPSARR